MAELEDDLEVDDMEIEETYHLNESKLPEIIQRINSEGCPIYLTRGGIRISGNSSREKGVARGGINIGLLVIGENIEADRPDRLYLQTYMYKGKRGEPDLVNLLREYIA